MIIEASAVRRTKGTEMDDRAREMSKSLRRAADGFARAGRGLMVAHECIGLAYEGLLRAATAAQETESSTHGMRDELGKMAHMAENLAAAVQHIAEEVRGLANQSRP